MSTKVVCTLGYEMPGRLCHCDQADACSLACACHREFVSHKKIVAPRLGEAYPPVSREHTRSDGSIYGPPVLYASGSHIGTALRFKLFLLTSLSRSSRHRQASPWRLGGRFLPNTME